MAPIAPVYDSLPPCSDAHEDELIRPPRWPDLLVFGNLAAQPEHDPGSTALRAAGAAACAGTEYSTAGTAGELPEPKEIRNYVNGSRRGAIGLGEFPRVERLADCAAGNCR